MFAQEITMIQKRVFADQKSNLLKLISTLCLNFECEGNLDPALQFQFKELESQRDGPQ